MSKRRIPPILPEDRVAQALPNASDAANTLLRAGIPVDLATNIVRHIDRFISDESDEMLMDRMIQELLREIQESSEVKKCGLEYWTVKTITGDVIKKLLNEHYEKTGLSNSKSFYSKYIDILRIEDILNPYYNIFSKDHPETDQLVSEGPPEHTPSETPISPEGKRPEYLAALLGTVPKDAGYDLLAGKLEEETRTFRQEVAASLLPALKDEMQRRPHATHDDKKELVGWVNAELRRFGLAIKFPDSDRAATLVAVPGNKPEEGRFQLRSEDEATGNDKTFNSVHLSKLLAVLELIEAAPRRESFLEWREKVAKPKGGSSRA